MAHSAPETDLSTPSNVLPSPHLNSDSNLQGKKSKRDVELTDQTNLLPFKKILPSFLGISLCIVVSTLDSVIVATALPTISAEFNAGSVVSWVPSAYLLTSTCFQSLYGRFSDIFGRKATVTAAMLIFIIGNLMAGFSRTIVQLIVFRGFAGAGGGAIFSMAQIIISDLVSLRDRGKYQGIIGGVVAVGYTIGPVVGGALAQKASWRWCFWVNIPISLCAVIVVNFILPLKPVGGDIKRKLLMVDYVGSGLSLIGCTLITLPLIWGGVTFPWGSAIVLATLICGVLVCILFVLWEWKAAALPIVPLRIFKHSTVCGVCIAGFINGFITFSSMFYLPQFFQAVLRYGPIHAGLFLIPVMVGQVVLNIVSGVIVSQTGKYRAIIYSGFSVWSIACGLISTMTARTSTPVMVVFMILAGVGAGQTLQTATVAGQASVPRREMSVVTAFRNFVRNLGSALALAVSASLINNTLRSYMESISLPGDAIKKIIDDPSILGNPAAAQLSPEQASAILDRGYNRGFRSVFILNASLSALAVLVGIVMIKHKNLTRDDDAKLKNMGREGGRHDPEKGLATPEKVSAEDSPVTTVQARDSAEQVVHSKSTPSISSAEPSSAQLNSEKREGGGI